MGRRPEQGVGGTSHSIDPKYRRWVQQYEQEHPQEMRRYCQSASYELQEAFPELRVVRGYARGVFNVVEPAKFDLDDVGDVDNGHFWCETVDGAIIDPTARQFLAPVGYQPIDESRPDLLPKGKCPNCGYHIYGRNDGICSDDCAEEYRKYLMRECYS